jgi:hypothetical protein
MSIEVQAAPMLCRCGGPVRPYQHPGARNPSEVIVICAEGECGTLTVEDAINQGENPPVRTPVRSGAGDHR